LSETLNVTSRGGVGIRASWLEILKIN